MTTVATSGILKKRQDRQEARFPIDIELEPQDDHIKVLRKKFDVEYGEGDVLDLNRRFIESLDAIRRKVQKQGKTLQVLAEDDCNQFLSDLRQIGSEAFAFFPEGAGEYISMRETDEGDRGIGLDFTFPPGMAFLWEMLYIGEPGPAPIDIDQFWGFRYPIGHLFWESDLKDWIRLQRGFFVLAHDRLESSIEEIKQLEQRLLEAQERLSLRVTLRRVEDVISQDALCSEKLMELFHSEDFVYGIAHFACHCVNPEDTGVSQAYLSLCAHRKEVSMKLGEFSVRARKYGFLNRPLVFLNACESATPLHLLQSLNFPTSLLKFGAGGVIATACAMPDNFAGAFATEFYRRLLDKPSATAPSYIGEALLETRLHFMEKYKNPLGLAYGLYAVSNQRLQLADY